jgi:chemotaxis protein methyltransferase CheR
MPNDVAQIELRLLMDAIYYKYDYDFRDYSALSQQRRVTHALGQMGCSTISALQEKVLHQPNAFLRLLQFLTVPVTSMFRDPGYFLALREEVAPVLHTYPSLKIWIAGCSSGEEVYSMAILLHEEGLLERAIIYATDINPRALEKAKSGAYPMASMPHYHANYLLAGGRRALSDYYSVSHGVARFDRALCGNISFADHSLATDNVFSETHLVSCRNVLIYFNKPLQNRALGLFHESLCRRGFLGLGNIESIDFSDYADRFEVQLRQQRLYRKL